MFLLLLLAVLLTALSIRSHELPDGAPLPWDMAHHTLRASRMAAALSKSDAPQLVAQLRYWDVYPPAVYVGVGTVQAIVGSEQRAWRIAQGATWLLLACAGWFGFARSRETTAALLLLLAAANGFLLSLAAQRMLDFPAAVMAILALAAMARVDGNGRRTVLAAAVTSLALLSKANAGLPACAVGAVFAVLFWFRGRRTRAAHLLGAVLVAGAVWAGFTSWQDHGWQAFFAFAENRANTPELHPLARGGRYLQLFASWYGGWWITGPLLLCVMAGLRRETTFSWMAFLYAVATWAAISSHPYFLSRNLSSASLALCIPAAVGLGRILRWARGRRPAWSIIPVLLAVQILRISVPIARAESERQMPRSLGRLAAPSRQLESWLANRSKNALVIGSFRELSKPWIESLDARHHDGKALLAVDLYYPLDAARSGRDPRWDERYVEVFDRVVEESRISEIFVIRVQGESAWRGADYAAWNAYKENYARCVERSLPFLLEERVEFADAGIELSRFSTDFAPVEFGEGWRAAETWGRWMAEETATLALPRFSGPAQLILELAPHQEQTRAIRIRVEVPGHEAEEWSIEGEPWRFQRFALELDSAGSASEVRLQILDAGTDAPSDQRLLAVQTLGVAAPEAIRVAQF